MACRVLPPIVTAPTAGSRVAGRLNRRWDGMRTWADKSNGQRASRRTEHNDNQPSPGELHKQVVRNSSVDLRWSVVRTMGSGDNGAVDCAAGCIFVAEIGLFACDVGSLLELRRCLPKRSPNRPAEQRLY